MKPSFPALATLASLLLTHAQTPLARSQTPAPQPATPAPTLDGGGVATLPPGPLVAPPPPFAHYVVTYKFEGADENGRLLNSPKEQPVQLRLRRSTEYVKSPRVGRMTTTFTDGEQYELWAFDHLLLEQFKDVPDEVYVTDPQGGSYPGTVSADSEEEYFMDAYPGFEWVEERMFVGQVEAFGKKCLLFRKEGYQRDIGFETAVPDPTPPTPGATPAEPKLMRTFKRFSVPTREAYVTIEERLPVALRIAKQTRLFSFLPTPNANSFPGMPPKIQQALASYIKEQPPVKVASSGKDGKGKGKSRRVRPELVR